MACQLRAAGEAVPYLAMIDTPNFSGLRRRPLLRRVADKLGRFAADPAGRLRAVRRRVASTLGRLGGARPPGEPVEEFREPVFDPLLLDTMPPGRGQLTDALRRLHDAADEARTHYEPRVFDGPVHLFQTPLGPKGLEAYRRDPLYGVEALRPARCRHLPDPRQAPRGLRPRAPARARLAGAREPRGGPGRGRARLADQDSAPHAASPPFAGGGARRDAGRETGREGCAAGRPPAGRPQRPRNSITIVRASAASSSSVPMKG